MGILEGPTLKIVVDMCLPTAQTVIEAKTGSGGVEERRTG